MYMNKYQKGQIDAINKWINKWRYICIVFISYCAEWRDLIANIRQSVVIIYDYNYWHDFFSKSLLFVYKFCWFGECLDCWMKYQTEHICFTYLKHVLTASVGECLRSNITKDMRCTNSADLVRVWIVGWNI